MISRGFFGLISRGVGGWWVTSFVRRQMRRAVDRAREYRPFQKTIEKLRDEQRQAAEVARRARPRTEFVPAAAPPPVSLSGSAAAASSVPSSSQLVPDTDSGAMTFVVRAPPVAAQAAVGAAEQARDRKREGQGGES